MLIRFSARRHRNVIIFDGRPRFSNRRFPFVPSKFQRPSDLRFRIM